MCVLLLKPRLQGGGAAAVAPANQICENIRNGETAASVAGDLEALNGLVHVATVTYDVMEELVPYSKCDYVTDLLGSIKMLLCNMLVWGVVLIMNACAIEGVLLLFFVLLSVQGAKRWVAGAAGVAPVKVDVHPKTAE